MLPVVSPRSNSCPNIFQLLVLPYPRSAPETTSPNGGATGYLLIAAPPVLRVVPGAIDPNGDDVGLLSSAAAYSSDFWNKSDFQRSLFFMTIEKPRVPTPYKHYHVCNQLRGSRILRQNSVKGCRAGTLIRCKILRALMVRLN